jgi:glycosyltransferase involved in cell wall biosynthesis
VGDQERGPRTSSTDRRIRVLWLIKGLGPGGAEQLLVSHARVGDASSFRYSVGYVVPWKDQLVARLADLGVESRCHGRGRRGGVLWPLRLLGVVRSGQYDVVHAHSPLLAVAARLSAATLRRSRRPAVVSTEHNVWERYAPPTRWANSLSCVLDNHRWAVSQRVAESTRGRAGDVTSVLVHGVVQADLRTGPGARARVREELGIDEDTPVVTTVANLRDQKDYPTLLEAARQVLDLDDNGVFLAVGQGPMADEIDSLHDTLNLGTRFRLLGYRADVPDVLAASDLFVLASKYEGYPIAVMEALSVGLPIVSTNVGGVPDTIVDGVEGLLVAPGDPDALAAALIRLLRDPEARVRMGQAAVVAGRRFDAGIAVAEQERTYKELAGRSSPEPRNSGIVA